MLLRQSLMAAMVVALAGCGQEVADAPVNVPPPVEDAAAGDQLVPVQGQETETQGGRDTVRTASATIDWDSARRDFAARETSDDARTFQIESGPEAPPVPVLLPSGLVRPATADRPTYRALDDGYFAKYPGLDYDITISGTNEWYSGGAGGREPVATDVVYTQTMTGAQIALNRYGAAYLVEFECNNVPGRMASDCIDEAEAREVIEALAITGTR